MENHRLAGFVIGVLRLNPTRACTTFAHSYLV